MTCSPRSGLAGTVITVPFVVNGCKSTRPASVVAGRHSPGAARRAFDPSCEMDESVSRLVASGGSFVHDDRDGAERFEGLTQLAATENRPDLLDETASSSVHLFVNVGGEVRIADDELELVADFQAVIRRAQYDGAVLSRQSDPLHVLEPERAR